MSRSKTDISVLLAIGWGLSGIALGIALPRELPFPFVWRDVTIVSLLSSIGLAMLIANWLSRNCRWPVTLIMALCLLAISAVSWSLGPMEFSELRQLPLFGSVLRTVTSLAMATGLLLLSELAVRRFQHDELDARHVDWAHVGLGLAILLALPPFYVHARNQHDLESLAGLLQQSRLGEASTLSRRMMLLSGRLEFRGRPIADLRQYLDQIVPQIEQRASQPAPNATDPDATLARARDFAILGRTTEAIRTLRLHDQIWRSAEGANLRGTIYETQLQYRDALEGYQWAEQMWSAEPPSESRSAGLTKATMGIAYCQRKRGAYRQAAATYQRLLALAPTAETHFLLAQFYDDAQQPQKAKDHALLAMQIDPAGYEQRGEELIGKLQAGQFGCWGI